VHIYANDISQESEDDSLRMLSVCSRKILIRIESASQNIQLMQQQIIKISLSTGASWNRARYDKWQAQQRSKNNISNVAKFHNNRAIFYHDREISDESSFIPTEKERKRNYTFWWRCALFFDSHNSRNWICGYNAMYKSILELIRSKAAV
jgi:hypothetical protein